VTALCQCWWEWNISSGNHFINSQISRQYKYISFLIHILLEKGYKLPKHNLRNQFQRNRDSNLNRNKMCTQSTVVFTRHPHAKTITAPCEFFVMKAEQAHRHGVKVKVSDYERCPKFHVKDDKVYGEVEERLCLRSGAVGKKLLSARR
jgi:hypothetical protein